MRKNFASLLTIAAMASAMLTGAAQAAGDLYIYNWGDYISPKLIEKFGKQFDVKVHVDTYDSNEVLLAKLKAGAKGYDIIIPGDYMISIMVREDLLAKVEPNKMSNFKNVAERWRDVYWDPGRQYSIPWLWGTTSLMIDADKVKGDPNTLAHLFAPNEEVKGKINMLRDVNDVINAALRYLNLPRCNDNPKDLKKLLALLLEQKQWVKSYNSETKEVLVSGEAIVSQNWNGYAMRARKERPSLVYAYPKEGYTGWMDNIAIPKTSPNIENAKQFMNFMMDPENAAMLSNYTKYANGIKNSEKYMDAELINAPEINVPEGAPEPEFVPPCSPEIVKLYDRVWTKLLR